MKFSFKIQSGKYFFTNKILLVFLLCFQTAFFKAQDNVSIQQTEVEENWPFMLSNLNTSQISSGILIDKVTTFSNCINYNTAENNLSNAEHFKQSLSELFRASDETRLISSQELNNRIIATSQQNRVDVGIINTTFHKLNFNEENPSIGGVTFNNNTGKYVAVSGRPTFIGKKIVVASPLKEYLNGSSFVFNFKNNLILNNATTTIRTLSVDFNDGNSPVSIISNGAIVTPSRTVNYTTTGAKNLRFIISFSDNTTLTTFGYLFVNYESPNIKTGNLPCHEPLKDKGVFTSTLPFQGYTESTGVFGKAEYTIFYGNNNQNKQMIKPIIIVDGFDPKDKRKVLDCDCEFDTTPAPNNCRLNNSDISITYNNMWPNVTITYNPENHESLEDLMFYNDGTIDPITGLPGRTNIIPELRSRGYDVIIINHPRYTSTNVAGQSVNVDGGSDYIERNAMVLVSFIQNYIKVRQTQAGSTEKLVLLGPSMGGQITRYALAHMEKRFAETNNPTWLHNARLWVSVDSPHHGANIPVGAQANIWFMGERLLNAEAKKQYYEELNSIAGKQQLISQFENGRQTGFLNGNSFFSTYQNNLNSNGVTNSNGYPVSNSNFRKIAMVNGSLSGSKVGIEKNTFLYMRGYIRVVWPFQSSTITLFRIHDKFAPPTGQTDFVFKGNGQNSRFMISLSPDVDINLTHPRYTLNVTNNSIKGSLDVVPGGTFKTAKYIQEAVSKGLRDAGIRQETRSYIEDHSFISSFSAIGHLYPNQNWNNPLNTNLACLTNRQTPFDSYFGSSTNTEHTSFTKEGAEWLFKELNDEPQAPWFPIQDNALTGPNTVCINSNATFSFNDICKVPSSVTSWEVTPNLQIIDPSAYSLIVKGLSSGQGKITAVFSNGLRFEKNVWVGLPASFSGWPVISGPTSVSSSAFATYTINSPLTAGATSFEWWLPYPYETVSYWNWNSENWQKLEGLASSGSQITVFSGNKTPINNGYIQVMVKNECGCGDARWLYVQHGVGGNNPFAPDDNGNNNTTYMIYPNPSSSSMNIDLRNSEFKPIAENNVKGELFDLFGQSKGITNIINNKANISVQNLNKGVYVLKIYFDDKVESHQVIVQ